jgi:hypothetical protein
MLRFNHTVTDRITNRIGHSEHQIQASIFFVFTIHSLPKSISTQTTTPPCFTAHNNKNLKQLDMIQYHYTHQQGKYSTYETHIMFRTSLTNRTGAGIAQSVQRLESNPDGSDISRTRPTPVQWVPFSFPGVKRSGRDVNHPLNLAPRLKKV